MKSHLVTAKPAPVTVVAARDVACRSTKMAAAKTNAASSKRALKGDPKSSRDHAPAAKGASPVATFLLRIELHLDATGGPSLTASIPCIPSAPPPAGTAAGKRWRAEGRREIARVYFGVLASKGGERAAVHAARLRALEIFAEPMHASTIRRLARVIKRRGGINAAPLRAFYDGRAGAKHCRAKKRAGTGATGRRARKKGL